MKLMFPPSLQVSLVYKKDLDDLINKAVKTRCGVRAVFLDRDGTINYDRGYLRDSGNVRLLPSVGKAIRLLNAANIPVIVVTNQSVVGRNEITKDELEVINYTILSRLRRYGAYYDALYYCPHDPMISPNCFCRKPSPGLLFRAALDFKVDLKQSFMIGDKLTDMQAGRTAGCKTIFISTEKPKDFQPDFIAPNLYCCIPIILKHLKSQ